MNPVGQPLFKVSNISQPRGMAPGMMGPSAGGRLHGIASKFTVKQEPIDVTMTTTPSVNLYLCQTGKETAIKKEKEDSKEKASIEVLNQAYQVLTKKNIKGSLSSFIDTIPGNFDHQDSSTLRNLIDRPPIGGREFLPISDQLLLGFRLHPGSLPEQYQLDPPTVESTKPHKKKKKHKHKHGGDKSDERSLDNYSPSISREHSPPVDPCDFIKDDQTNSFFPPPVQSSSATSYQPSSMPHLVTPSHHTPTIIHTPGGGIPLMMTSNSPLINFTSQPSVIVGGAGTKFPGSGHTHSTIPGVSGGEGVLGYQMVPAGQMLIGTNPRMIPAAPTKQKKVHKRHDNGDGSGVPKKKKKEKKEKRKKKHHLEQPLLTSSATLPSPLSSSSSSTHTAPPPLVHSNYLSRPP